MKTEYFTEKENNMINLIFDLNNIAHRSMFVVGGFGAKQFTFDSESEVNQLMRKMAMDVAYLIRLINPSRVIFALDSKSWRKDIEIDENEGYKGTRKKSSIINWGNVYGALDEFADLMESNGMIVSRIKNAEADDLATLWANELQLIRKEHVIVISGDEDLRQLVRFYPVDPVNKKFVFSTVFNPFMQGKNASRKLYVPHHFEQWLNDAEEVDFFNMKGSIDIDKQDFEKIINGERTRMEHVDGRMIGIRKMFCGDDGDNVPAIHSWIMKDKDGNETLDKNGEPKIVRITNSKFEKIYDAVKLSDTELMDHYDLLERSENVLEAIKDVSKEPPTFDIKERLQRQIKLVVLDSKFFPEEIVKEFDELKGKELERDKINYSQINMHDLLEGTKYVSKKSNETEASIFKEIDRIIGIPLF